MISQVGFALAMLLCTVAIFIVWQRVQLRYKKAWLNAMLLSIISIVTLLSLAGISYDEYWLGGQVLGKLIEPAVVVLGYPLYKQMRLIGAQWRELLLCSVFSVFCSLTVVCLLSRLAGLDELLILSLSTFAVTTAIAMETSALMGGDGALAAVCVMLGGLTGATLGVTWIHKWRVRDERALGFAIGACAHALGAASIAHRGHRGMAYATCALILCALTTALIAPYYVPYLLKI